MVHRNKLTGQVPTMSNLPKMWQLWLHCNQFTGTIPSSLNGLQALSQVYLFENQLRGEIPDLSDLNSLQQLYLSHNNLEGDFSDTATLLAKLPTVSSLELALNNNRFIGVDQKTGNIANLPTLLTTITEAPCTPRPSFDSSTATVNEGSTVTVTVNLGLEVEESVTIPITVAHNNGTTSGDYSGPPASLTFNSMEASKTFTMTVTDDSDDDDGESLTLGFGTLPDGVVTVSNPATMTITLLDNDAPQVAVSFEQAAYTVTEGGGPVAVTVELSADPERTVTIPISLTHNGGATAADYSGLPSSVTFNSEQMSQTFNLFATDDSDDDDGESLTLRFGALPDGLTAGNPAMSIVSLQDNDLPSVTVSYEQSAYAVDEGSSVSVKVTLSADPERTATIPIARTLEGGASSADYSGVPTSVIFDRGDREKVFTFSATADNVDDDGEAVRLAFGTLPAQVSGGAFTEALVSIDDAGSLVSVAFAAATYTATEGGNAATVTVELDADPQRTLTIPLSATGNQGASGNDYSGVPNSVTFNSGETSQTFTVTATDDNDDDDGESVTLRFGTLPVNVAAGSPAVSIVELRDNDRRRAPAPQPTKTVVQSSPPAVVDSGPPTVAVSFALETYTAAEWGSAAMVTVELDADPKRTVTIPLNVAFVNGASVGDYSGVPASVTFNSGGEVEDLYADGNRRQRG